MRVFERLCLACDLSYRNVEVELDCLTVVRIILGQSTTGANSSLVQHIVQMKLRLTRLGGGRGSNGRQFGGALAYGSWDVLTSLEIFRPRKLSRGGRRFGFVRMKSRTDAVRTIERMDGFTLYGYRLTVKLTRFKPVQQVSNFGKE
ncbi:hypothetical protein V6N11_016558 [Hibiscus sabdariffa]|uniref:RRM domain-containing protein n=1 Tax=Hibiscus sabdariffa TaxID=183260 RepID=A0ABR2TVH8_9ROSI